MQYGASSMLLESSTSVCTSLTAVFHDNSVQDRPLSKLNWQMVCSEEQRPVLDSLLLLYIALRPRVPQVIRVLIG